MSASILDDIAAQKLNEVGWESPQELPSKLPEVPEFDKKLLPSVLSVGGYALSRFIQAPIDFIAVAYLVSLSSLVARKVAIKPLRNNDWKVVPNLWGLVVGRPSAKKTPAMSAALRQIEALEDEAGIAFETAIEEFELQKQFFSHCEKATTSDIQKKLKSSDPESKRDAMYLLQEQIESKPEPPLCTRYLANDSTCQKLAEILKDNPSILIFRDELQGFFASLEQHSQEGARAFYLESWSGDKPYKVDRISRESTRVPRACVSILGGIQPGPIGGMMRELQRNSRANDGLLQRFQIAVWPDLSPVFELVDEQQDASNQRAIREMYTRIASVEPEAIEADCSEEIPFLRFDDDAQQIFARWVTNHENWTRSEELPECLEAHYSKYQSMVPSIALTLHLAEGYTGPVGKDCLAKAIAWSEYLKAHAKRLYAPVIGADYVSARALAQKIRSGKITDSFRLREVYRHGWSHLSSPAEAKAGADVLCEFSWIAPNQAVRGDAYLLNPALRCET